jgi:siderophore synthetase component/MFS family permease
MAEVGGQAKLLPAEPEPLRRPPRWRRRLGRSASPPRHRAARPARRPRKGRDAAAAAPRRHAAAAREAGRTRFDRERRQVYVVVFCYFVASFAALGLPPYLTAMLPELGDRHARWAGVLYVTPTICTGLSAPLWGRLADRFGGRRMLLRAQFGLVGSFALAGFARSLPLFTLALALQGLFGGTFAATNTYLAGLLRDRDGLSWALTLMQGSARAALVAAPIIVGSLTPVLAPHRQYTVMALLPLAAAVAVLLLPAPTASAPTGKRADGPSTSVADQQPPPPLWVLNALQVAFVFSTVVSFPYLIALLGQRLPGMPPFLGGVLFALPHLCYLLLAKPVHTALAPAPMPGIAAGFALIALSTGGHLLIGSLAGAIALRLLLGLGLTLGLVGLSVLAGQVARGRPPGRMFGSLELYAKAGAVLAGVLAASSANALGRGAPMLLGALVAALVTVALLRPTASANVRPAHPLPARSLLPHQTSAPPAPDGSPTMNATASPAPFAGHDLPSADEVVAHTLLNCLLREVSGPEHQATVADDHLLIRLPRRDLLLRVRLRRVSLIGAHRFTGEVAALRGGGWEPVGWQELAQHISAELELRTGLRNEEFLDQVASSHRTMHAMLTRHQESPVATDRYLASEQALLYGHRFHPTPKARSGRLRDWWRYAPEAGARFTPHLLAVRTDLIRQQEARPHALESLDGLGYAPEGYLLLPVHPWQYALLSQRPALVSALERGDVLDLGRGGGKFAPTASVRTLYDGERFLKFSLNVRITNCLRKNAEYELAGAVALTRVLTPIFDGLAERFPGCALLAEPAYRTLDIGDRTLLEGFGVILRDGFGGRLWPGVRPLLAAAIADEHPTSPAQAGQLLTGADLDTVLRWWRDYLRLLIPPVVAAYCAHGVVLEPHLQNVVVGVDPDGMPAQVFFRDLEGAKLLPEYHRHTLAGLPESVAAPMTYDSERGWNRLVYCLLVNHVAELVGALADLHPRHEAELWEEVREVLCECAGRHDFPPRLRALLSGVPLPAKANLLTRWQRRADRDAGYVPLPSPLSAGFLSGVHSDLRGAAR